MATSADPGDVDAFLAALTGRIVEPATSPGDLAAGEAFAGLMARLWELPIHELPAPEVFRADRGWPR